MTKDKVDTLLGALDKSSLGADDGNVIREPRSTRILVSVIAMLSIWSYHESSLVA